MLSDSLPPLLENCSAMTSSPADARSSWDAFHVVTSSSHREHQPRSPGAQAGQLLGSPAQNT